MTGTEIVVSAALVLIVTVGGIAWQHRRRRYPAPSSGTMGSVVETAVIGEVLFGRTAEIQNVQRSESSVVVIYGDPGIGKSEVMRAACRTDEVLSPMPVQLAHHSGALQISLLESLGAAVAMRVDDGNSAARAGMLLVAAVQGVVDQRARDLAAAALGFLSGVLRDRVGDTIGDLVEDTVSQVKTSASEQLVDRIAASSNPDVVKAFVTLAREARQFAQGPIALSLDSGERLSEDDLRILYDLIDLLPEGVTVRVAIATTSGREVGVVGQLRARGALPVHLEPLGEEDVLGWLAEENVAAGHVVKVMEVTAGYPLYVDAAIGHLQAGLTLHDLPTEQSFVAQTEQLFRRLDADCQRAALYLAAFTDPPLLVDALASVGQDEAGWSLLEGRLQDERMFATIVNGRPWFHELRRRALWSDVLSDEQRTISAKFALARIVDQVDRDGHLSLTACMDLARLSAESEEFLDEHANLREALDVSPDALGFLGAVMELSEPGSEYEAVGVEAAIRHAREAFGVADDLLPTVRSLAEGDLVYMVENEQAAVVVLTWESAMARFAVAGRLAQLTNRTPVPRLATATFQIELGPRLGQFESAAYGVGHPSLTTMSKSLKDTLVERDGQHVAFLPERPGALVRMRVGSIDLYAGVLFADQGQRDAASQALSGLSDPHFYGQHFEVSSVTAWPQQVPLPSMRFVNAAALVSGVKFGGDHGSTLGYEHPIVSDLREETEITRRTYAVIRELASPMERSVLDLNRERGYLYGRDERGALIAEVANGDSVVEIEITDAPHPWFGPQSPFAALQMEQAAGLLSNQHVTHTVFRSAGTAQDPVPDIIKTIEKKIREYNRAQRTGLRVEVRLDQEGITEAIQVAQDQRSNDAAALLAAGVLNTRDPVSLFQDLYVAINPGPEREGWVTGAEGHLFYVRAAAVDRNSVRVRVLDDDDEFICTPEQLAASMGLVHGAIPIDSYTSGDLIGGLAGLLGYARDAVWLVR